MRSGRRSDLFGPPPANTELGYQAYIVWAAWDGLGDLATLPAATPPKGLSMPSTYRNYAGPQHFCHYRGCDSAWVPRTVLGARIGRSNLLFRIDLGLTGLPCFPLYSSTLSTARPNYVNVAKGQRICVFRSLLPAGDPLGYKAKRRSSA